jgi:hypothetical protein
MIAFEIDWTDPTTDETNWKGRTLVFEIDWTDPTTDETNWKG